MYVNEANHVLENLKALPPSDNRHDDNQQRERPTRPMFKQSVVGPCFVKLVPPKGLASGASLNMPALFTPKFEGSEIEQYSGFS